MLEEVTADATVVVLRASKPLALLVYLAAQVGRPSSRDALADLLWGDESPDAARPSLRQALHTLRRILGPDAIIATREEVMLAEGALTYDAASFEVAAATGDARQIGEWYRGPFGERLTVRGANGFEQWMTAERERLRRLLLAAAERVLGDAAAAGRQEEGGAFARAVILAEPAFTPLVLRASDALLAAGDFAGAQHALERLQSTLLGIGEEVPTTLRQRLERVAGMVRDRARAAPSNREALGRRFVGRGDIIAALFRALEQARLRGTTTRIALVGPPGIGKSRLLDEFEARLRPRGTRVVRVRILPAMREIPGSGLAAVVRALCGMSGAMGISERSAATIVAMLPELREQFPAAIPQPTADGDIPRYRGEALRDLLGAIAEERLLVLLIDDEQNMDAASRAVLDDGLTRRDLRLLEVRASRSAGVSDGAERYQLPPLGTEEIRELLEGEGSLPSAEWVEPLMARLTTTSAGIPQLLLQQVRGLQGLGLLVLQDGAWSGDADGLRANAAADVGDLSTLVSSLSPAALRVLRVLALWRQPLSEVAITGMVPVEGGRNRDHGRALREALAELEWTGMAGARPAGWMVAHDTIADVTLRGCAPGVVAQLLMQSVRFWCRPGQLTVPVVEHLALLCGSRGERQVLRALTRAASRERMLRQVGLRGAALAERIAAAAGHPEWRDDLFRSMRWLERTSRRTVLTMGATAGAVLAGCAVLAFLLWPRLVVESVPMSDQVTVGFLELAVQPRVGVYDGFGRHLKGYDASIRVSVGPPAFRIVGDTLRPLEDGSAQFEGLGVEVLDTAVLFRPDSMVMYFDGSGVVRGVSTGVQGSHYGAPDHFRVLKVVLNGEEIDPRQTHSLPTGDSVEVTLTYEFTTKTATANYIVGAAPTWEPRERASIRLAGLPRPVARARQTRNIKLAGPGTPGIHHVIILMAPEGGVENIFSATNWVIGRPIWYDGNDVADFSIEQRRALRDSGWTTTRLLNGNYPNRQADVVTSRRRFIRPGDSRQEYVDLRIPGYALELEFIDLGDSRR